MFTNLEPQEFFVVLAITLFLLWDFGGSWRHFKRWMRRRRRKQDLRALSDRGYDY